MAKDLKQFIKDKKAQQAVNAQAALEGGYLALDMDNITPLGSGGSITEALDDLYTYLVYLKKGEYRDMNPLNVIQTKSWERYGLKIVKAIPTTELEFTFTLNEDGYDDFEDSEFSGFLSGDY